MRCNIMWSMGVCLLFLASRFVVDAAFGSNNHGGVSRRNNSASTGTHDIFTCCADVYGSCRASCENLSLVQLAVETNGREYRLNDVKKFCPSIQVEFWGCMNRTLQAVYRGTQWSGRQCCVLAKSLRCQNACSTSASIDELSYGCRQSDEQHMYSCFEKQEKSDECCSKSRTSECLQACRGIFQSGSVHSVDVESQEHVEKACGESNSNVLECVRNYTDLSPVSNSEQDLPCCQFSSDPKCRETCQRALRSTKTTNAIIDDLEAGGCGPPLLHDPLWQCFLSAGRKMLAPSSSNEVSQINHLGMDSAKLHCCHKAVAPKCRRLCAQTFSNDWTVSRNDFDFDCLMQPNELELRQCIDEVDEPCQLGCDGLSFCSNFNNRPAELFRSCNINADIAARLDVLTWTQQGYVSLPGTNLPIKNITKCSPEKWRSIACTLQIKPCTRTKHLNQICREDCYEILSECMDWTRADAGITAASICSKLSPDDEDVPCISLKPYLEPSDVPSHTGGHHSLTSPCKGNPCNATEVCLPKRNESMGYQCVPGCSLGEASSYLVPFGAYVRTPISSTQKGCLKICRCGTGGRIDHCQPLPCVSYDSCSLGGTTLQHATWFYVECNICSCFAGEITCTKKQCNIPGFSDHSYTSLPCNCPPHYVPVCGRNGNTYHSACIAKCIGLQDTDIDFGACRAWNPCEKGRHSCPMGTKCVEDRKICLSVMHRPCLQYQCVNTTSNNCSDDRSPVCDTRGRTHMSICHLLRAGAELAFPGACFRTCSTNGLVCGVNGVTYRHECEAWADYSLTDYKGKCQEVGLLSSNVGRRCRVAHCRKLPPHCRPITPPGSCCPICGGALRIIFSRKQVDRALYALKGKNLELLTLKNVLKALDGLVHISECQLVGFLTMETDIFVAILPRTNTPTQIQTQACSYEAQRLATLIETQSHFVTSSLALSALTVATMVAPNVGSSGCVLSRASALLLGLACFLVLKGRKFVI